MVSPSFEIARGIGNNLSQAFTKVKDENSIEAILSNAMNNPEQLQNSIGKILSQVSPERQEMAIQYLQNAYKNVQAKKQEDTARQAAKEAGYTYGVPPQVAAQQLKDRAKGQRLASYGVGGGSQFNLPNAENGTPPSLQGGERPQQAPGEFSLKNIPEEKLIALTGAPDREVSEPAKAELKRREAERKNDRADIREKRKETQQIRQEIANRAAIAQQGIQEKERLVDLINTGKINDPTYAVLLEALPMKLGQRFLSNETVEYKAGLVNGYRDLRNIFTGATRVKEIELLEQKIADIYLTDEQKKSILKSSLQSLQYDLIRAEAASEVEKENPSLGVLEFQKAVNAKAKPKLNSLANRIIDEQKSFIRDAENRKKIPLDYSDPESRQILEQILKEAGGDRNKARKIAKDKGYIVGK